MSKKVSIYVLFMVLAVISRLIPHPANFTAAVALSLFLGVRSENKSLGMILTLLPMIIVDSYLGFHSTTFYVYGALLVIFLLSHTLLAGKKIFSVGISSLVFAVLFYLITNFGVWMVDHIYPPTVDGLIQCYKMGIPFLKGQILGDLFYTIVLVGVWDYLAILLKKNELRRSRS